MASSQRQRSARLGTPTVASATDRSEYSIDVDTGGEAESFSSSMSMMSMSPNRRSRLMEKETLSHLNDRLAVYIDRVRQLELENERLNVRINESEVVEKKERTDLVGRYEAKIKELRDLLDETLKDKARMSMDTNNALAERDNLRAKMAKLEKDLKQLEKQRLSDENLIQDLQARLGAADSARRHLDDEFKSASCDNIELKRQLEVLRRQIEDETLANTALQNQNHSLKEDYDFLKKTHESQLEEIHRKRQVEMTTTAREMERTYESRLQEQLQAMRDEFDARLIKNRRDIDEAYKNKMNEANEARQEAQLAREDSARLRLRIRDLEKTGSTHEQKVDALNKKIADLENQLRYARDDYEVRIQQRDNRIAELQKEIDRLLTEYQDLFELKIQLDTELKAYQNLLEGEENRLNISHQSSQGGDRMSFSTTESSPRRGIKRKRFAASDDSLYYRNTAKTYKVTANSDCDIEIEAHDADGKFVKLTNKGDDIVSIGHWSVKSVAGDRETVYKFHNRQNVKPGDSITVWSANSGSTHAPPANLVMKNQQWPHGDRITTSLVQSDGTVMATRESVAEFQYGSLMHGDGQDPERCSVM